MVTKETKFKKNDFILVAIIIIIACGIFILYKHNQKIGKRIRIRVDNEIYKILPLDTNYDDVIISKNGGTNRIIIKNGFAMISEANCPDKICVHQKPINKSGETLVCLPHKIIVDVLDDNIQKEELDTISS